MDNISFTILETGDIKIETDKVSQPNHINAERFLAECIKLAGGPVKITKKHSHGAHGHSHSHGQDAHQH